MNFLRKAFKSYRLTDRQTYIQTDRQTTKTITYAASRVVQNWHMDMMLDKKPFVPHQWTLNSARQVEFSKASRHTAHTPASKTRIACMQHLMSNMKNAQNVIGMSRSSQCVDAEWLCCSWTVCGQCGQCAGAWFIPTVDFWWFLSF